MTEAADCKGAVIPAATLGCRGLSRLVLCIVVLALIGGCAPLASRHIEVYVFDDVSDRPIAGASVVAGRGDVRQGPGDPSNYDVVTDSAGRATCRVLEYPTNELRVDALGYNEYRASFSCPDDLSKDHSPSLYQPWVHPVRDWRSPHDTARFDVRLKRKGPPSLVLRNPPEFHGIVCIRWGAARGVKDEQTEVYRVDISPGGLVLAPRGEDLMRPGVSDQLPPFGIRWWGIYCESQFISAGMTGAAARQKTKYWDLTYGRPRSDYSIGWVGSQSEQTKILALIQKDPELWAAVSQRLADQVAAETHPIEFDALLALRKAAASETLHRPANRAR